MSRPDHFCPGCGAALKSFPRYPWHFCNECRGLATDAAGKRLEFGNASASGGLAWRRRGDTEWVDSDYRVICLIHGRRVMVTEARFGGMVAQPLLSGPAPRMDDPKLRDLSR
ncbi:MAG: ADP-ribosylglycohydrolase [Pseudomonadota bacterium]